ncbi:UrcA family protein [Sphingomonas montanisoli]|uniref:UrcA family protein n=1 Tax=Sphingomonas montanisoli TaxID=2606412 RepID=A0A5D9CDG6_9SPHN|nr:UrcA family protein [Sphingomonas montanisoli]TZG29202.1 UrcA family protein [Sphingomonas montanisoli]
MNATNKIFAAVAAVAAATVNIAFAAPVNAAPAVTVAYGDLDLNSEQGNTELQGRLHRAADKVCGRREAAIVTAVCRQKTVSIARQQMTDATHAGVVLASR